jgi:hypothetical protein
MQVACPVGRGDGSTTGSKRLRVVRDADGCGFALFVAYGCGKGKCREGCDDPFEIEKALSALLFTQ